MGRNTGSVVKYKEPFKQAKSQVRQALGTYDVAEFQAQLHAVEAVETLYQFMSDPLLAHDFRRNCALDILERAYGKPTNKSQISLTAPPPDSDVAADPVATQIEAAKVKGQQFLELQAYIDSVPFSMWPDHVKEMAGPDAAVYAEIEHNTTSSRT